MPTLILDRAARVSQTALAPRAANGLAVALLGCIHSFAHSAFEQISRVGLRESVPPSLGRAMTQRGQTHDTFSRANDKEENVNVSFS